MHSVHRPILKKSLVIVLAFLLYVASRHGLAYFWPRTSATLITINLGLALIITLLAISPFFSLHLPDLRLPGRAKVDFTVLIIATLLVILLVNPPTNIVSIFDQRIVLRTLALALTAGMFEEGLCRGLLFSTLTDVFVRRRYRFVLVAICNSAIFGGLHLLNLFTTTQGLTATLQQITTAFAIGVTFSAIRLYAHGLLVPIILHTCFDFQPTIASASGDGQSSWIAIIIVFGVLFILAITTVVLYDHAHDHQSSLSSLDFHQFP